MSRLSTLPRPSGVVAGVRAVARRYATERRYDRLAEINRLDPDIDYEEIARLHATLEFPWDTQQALSFALFRTYAVPTVGHLLYETGEFTERVQKRYDDTGLLLDEVLQSGLSSVDGRNAVRRINQMHKAYDISNEDFLYVLATFVVTPVRWLERFGWRPVSEVEVRAGTNYYRALGRHMNISGIPGDYDGFAELLDTYEAENFAFDEGARKVGDATLELMTTFVPFSWLPAPVVRRFAYALMDEHLLDAFRYPHPHRWERMSATAGLRLRATVVRLLPVRTERVRQVDSSTMRSYPQGFSIDELGTFPRGCPVAHSGAGVPTPDHAHVG
ncbi:oxygenase MpaB family protein [Williamsia sterculiae]|uniref:ER-bound oxygenase mpaB/mpaB'/Rubber oxygenase catalytic domain-containing protein n=1 Tax=Williamsia sterculiae TaxID=1344003 RepID=A0A1N7H9W2_9NOCA|nr:oxygenase MpaB family protein [Williamsia sterculiae]SIS21646.1 hypothetical protein SAMN05445060_3798 [Williamsia sterculiae]